MRGFIGVVAAVLMAGCGGGATDLPSTPNSKQEPKSVKDPKIQGTDVRKLDLLAGLERRTLPNGLTVLVKEDHRLPIATMVISYRVGSVHEIEGTTGLAHFLEHMMFKGTDQLKKGEIDAITFSSGGFNNAYTTNDYTAYWFTVHSEAFDRFLQIESNRMRNCLLDRSEWESELGVVIEELNRSLDRPWGKLFHELEPAVFKESSYHHPVIGFRKDLDNMKYENMVQFYKDYYGPNNATLVVVGDVKKDAAFARITELFGRIEKVKEAVPPKMPEPPQAKEERADFQSDKSLHRLGVAFRSDKVGTATDIQLDVLSQILTSGKDSRLYKRLVIKDRACTDVSAYNDSRKHDGAFFVLAELQDKAEPSKTEEAILDELDKLKKEGVGDRELTKAKNIIAANFVFSKERQYSLADDIAKFEAFGASNYLKEYLPRVDAVTSADLQELAKRIFRAENRTASIAKAKPQRAAGAPQSASTMEFGEYYEYRLRNGLTLLVKPQKDLPIVSVQAYVESGSLYEGEDHAGVSNLLGRLLDQGVDPPGGTARTAEQIAETVEFTGSQLSTSANGVSFKTLTTHEQLAYDFVRDLLMYPTFPAARVGDMKQLQLSEISAKADAPELVAQEMFFEAVYAGHPMHRPDLGYERTVNKLTRADVVAHHQKFFRPDNTIIAVSGDVNPANVLLDIRRRFAEWSAPPTELPVLPPLALHKETQRIIKTYDTGNQINYVLGHLSLDRANPDYFALRVLEHLFCRSTGFADRLSKTVRDDHGLAYEVWGVLTQQADKHPGPFMIYVGTARKNGAKPVELIHGIIDDLKKNGPKPEEMELAKNFLLRNLPFSWQSADQLSSYMITLRRMNLGIDFAKRYVQQIKAVTREDLIRVAAKYIVPEALTTVIVGPVDKDTGIVIPEPEVKKEEGK